MMDRLREAVTAQLMRVEIVSQPPAADQAASADDRRPPPGGQPSPERQPSPLPFGPSPTLPFMEAHKVDPTTGEDEMALADAPAGGAGGAAGGFSAARSAQRNPGDPKSWGKVGRNEPCPCGSGKKYKHCHGRFA